MVPLEPSGSGGAALSPSDSPRSPLAPDEDAPTGLPLAGIRVADFSRVLAGPLATMLLGDLGADVVKVERPGTGDDTRGWGPPFVGGDAAYFLALNRNKRSVALDLATVEGRSAARRLALSSDVVVENFRPGLMERFGLDHATLAADNAGARVLLAHRVRRGGDGTSRPGYDIIVQALSGLMSFTGQPGAEPTKVGVALLDVVCGLYACERDPRGARRPAGDRPGSPVSVSLFDASLAAMVNQAANYLLGGLVPGPLGNAHPNIVPYQLFETADRPFILAAGNDRMFERTCEVLGAARPRRGRALRDERGARPPSRRPDPGPRRPRSRRGGPPSGSWPWRPPASRARRCERSTRCSPRPRAPPRSSRSTIPRAGRCAWSPTRSGSTARCRRCAGHRPGSASTRTRSSRELEGRERGRALAARARGLGDPGRDPRERPRVAVGVRPGADPSPGGAAAGTTPTASTRRALEALGRAARCSTSASAGGDLAPARDPGRPGSRASTPRRACSRRFLRSAGTPASRPPSSEGRGPRCAPTVEPADVVVCDHVLYNVRRPRAVRPGARRPRAAPRRDRDHRAAPARVDERPVDRGSTDSRDPPDRPPASRPRRSTSSASAVRRDGRVAPAASGGFERRDGRRSRWSAVACACRPTGTPSSRRRSAIAWSSATGCGPPDPPSTPSRRSGGTPRRRG